eukprot:7620642-Lingulodinium_polyedra.AAC.1
MLQRSKPMVSNNTARKPNNTVLAVHGNVQCGTEEASSDEEETEMDDSTTPCGNTGAAIIQDYRLPPSPTP